MRRINKTIEGDRKAAIHWVLDIYGFENLVPNGFEQLFINYANEKLQYLFNEHVFKVEQEEYNREGIDFVETEFPDNTACLALIEKAPNGILPLINEQCMQGDAGNDRALAAKMHKTHARKGKGKQESLRVCWRCNALERL